MLQTVPVRDVRTGLRYKTGANVPQSIRCAQGEGRHAEQGGKPADSDEDAIVLERCQRQFGGCRAAREAYRAGKEGHFNTSN